MGASSGERVDQVDRLAADIAQARSTLAEKGGAHEPERLKTGTGC